MRKGYKAEYQIKKELEETYGRGNVIKTSCSQDVPDFIVIFMEPSGRSLWRVHGREVKSTVKKRYYPSPRDKKQFKMFRLWEERTGVRIHYHIVYRRKPKNIVETYDLDAFEKKFMGGKK